MKAFFTFGQNHTCTFQDIGNNVKDYWVEVETDTDNPREVFMEHFTKLFCPTETQFGFEYQSLENLNTNYFPGGILVKVSMKDGTVEYFDRDGNPTDIKQDTGFRPMAEYLFRQQSAYVTTPTAVFNPLKVPVEELPFIFGLNNGGSPGWRIAVLLAQDGMGLGRHVCSDEYYMWVDLGCLEGSRPDRHKTFQEHYPEGYRMQFVPTVFIKDHKELWDAISFANYVDYEEDVENGTTDDRGYDLPVADVAAMVHDWVPSTLGHGETMCTMCKMTNREAAATGQLNECPRPVRNDAEDAGHVEG